MRARLMIGGLLGLAAWGGFGCGSDDGGAGRAVAAPRLVRPELVVFRVTGRENVRSELVTARANGATIRRLFGASARDQGRPALFERAVWSPNGRRLAFTADVGQLGERRRDIYLIRSDGSGLRRLTFGGRSLHPLWSPDGRRIFFARRPPGPGRAKTESDARRLATASIWSMRPNGSDRRRVTRLVDGRAEVPGSFSPDRTTLAFTRHTFALPDQEGRVSNTAELWTMRSDGSEARRLAERSADPVFSPDGRRIAFVSDRDEHGELSYGDQVFFANELYVMDADGSSPRRLTRTRALNEGQPSWLPSGARIAYQRGRAFQDAEGTVVIQANADGSCARAVLADPRLDRWYAAPVWRPGDARRGDGALRC
jgi:Tol biopolymer transport system component